MTCSRSMLTASRFVLPRLVVVTLLALAALAASAPPASAEIYDPDVWPQSSWVIDTAGGADTALDVAVNSAGTAYVCGKVTSVGGDTDGSLYKFPLSGAGWRKTWDGLAHDDDAFTAVAVAPDGSVYTAGHNDNAAGQLDIRLVKWSSAGEKVWSRRYTGPVAGDDTATDVVVDADGNVSVCGESQGTKGTAFTVISWTRGGTLRWVRRIEGAEISDDRANAMVADGSGNLYVVGHRGYFACIRAGYAVKLSAANVKKWSHTYTGADTVEFTALTKRPAGGVFVCGHMLSFDTGWDGVVISYTAAGTRKVFAVDTYDGEDATETYYWSVATTPASKVGVAAGTSFDYGASYARHLKVYSADTGLPWAALAWTDPYPQRLIAAAADAYGGLYFTGTDAISASHTAIWTRRYSTIIGGGTWTSTFGATDVGRNEPYAIATWKTTVWVVGTLYLAGGDADQVVLKYVY